MNEWDLGDGYKTSESPGGTFRYIYETAGIYTVTLIARNEYGADTQPDMPPSTLTKG
ncbi:PKD domain-containing protein [bacterium]|nr:PKD domain-containing protein [bacterium]